MLGLNMFDRFDCWQYRADANCWDFVRQYLIEKAGVPAIDVPMFGISPDNKRQMTKAARGVALAFTESEPVSNAIACHYMGNILFHVGIVEGGNVRHTSSQRGTVKESIAEFERHADKTTYMIHRSLCQS